MGMNLFITFSGHFYYRLGNSNFLVGEGIGIYDTSTEYLFTTNWGQKNVSSTCD